MKKILMFTVVVLTGLLFMPLTQAQDLIGTVSVADNKDSVLNGTKYVMDNKNSANITITYEAANLKIVDQNSGGVDRKTDAAWVGFTITTPTDASNNTNKVKINDVEYDADTKGEYYFAITQDKLEKGKPIVYTCEFDWNYQNETFSTDQTVTITINPAIVTLVEKDGDKVAYDGPAIAEAKRQEAQKQEENKENTENSTDNTKNPNTADSIYLWLGILAISGIGLGYFVQKLN